MKKTLIALATAAIGFTSAVHAEESFYGGFMGSYVVRDNDLGLDNGYGATVLVGAPFTPRLNWEGHAFYSQNDIENFPGDIPTFGGGLDLRYSFSEGQWRPFVIGGVGGQVDNFKDVGGDRESAPFANLGLGLIAQMGETRAFRAEVRGYAVNYKSFPGDNTVYDMRVNFGVMFGGQPRSAPVVAAAATPPPPPPPAPPAAPLAPAPAPVVAPAPVPAPVAPAKPAPAPALERFALKGVTFDTAKATIRPAGKPKLDAAVSALKANPDVKVEIHGYTDSQGNAKSNEALSQRRADAVKAYLVKNGVAADRLSAHGHGPADPIDSNDTPAGRANNRRVELVVK